MADEETVRCRKCRKILITNSECLINAHSQKHQKGKNDSTDELVDCALESERSCLYIAEDFYPSFIVDALDESSWTKGKLHCPGCRARLGSFNFISGSHCACKSHIVPQVHLLVSKVDIRRAREALPHPVSYPDHPVSLSATNTETLPVLLSSGTQEDSTVESGTLPNADLQSCNDESILEANSSSNTSQDFSDMANIKPSTSSKFPNASPKRGSRIEIRKRRRSWRHGDAIDSTEHGLDEITQCEMSTKAFNFHVLPSEDITTDTSSDNEELKRTEVIPEHMVCSVCLDVLYSPLMVQPCNHVFCEPCLRRVAKRNPNDTKCPLCRQLIGQCVSSKELSSEIRERFPDQLRERQLFEQKHNIQHLPLPWNRNFRLNQYMSNNEGGIIQMAGGWRPILLLLAGNALGLGSLTLLKWYLESQKEVGSEGENPSDIY
ncbi:hypothetical protein SK128_027491 [Halocaridina rubra]|uniref:RING-type domain-containing protein n=1 Tax=Halocaridina rubra TaxID=373956 RepID=A0AAN8ZPG4_HALRR